MALEDLVGTLKYIDALVITNPNSSDPKSEGDNHLQGIKNVLVNTFPNISGICEATHTELSYNASVVLGAVASSKVVTLSTLGICDFNDLVIDNPILKSYKEYVDAQGSVGATVVVDIADGNVQTLTLSADVTSMTLTGPATGQRGTLTLEITNTTYAITWPSSIKWPSNVTPPNSNNSTGIDVYTFTTVDGGVTWLGWQVGYNMS